LLGHDLTVSTQRALFALVHGYQDGARIADLQRDGLIRSDIDHLTSDQRTPVIGSPVDRRLHPHLTDGFTDDR